jgi:NADH-quinone oxidoreductase subunit G
MIEQKQVIIDGRPVAFDRERNLLEVIRNAGINLPTFCYHSELSIYGACRLCIVDIEGMGIVTSCSTEPRPGMKIQTATAEIRDMRKIFLELLLADHERECPTCQRSNNCKLQDLTRRMGVETVRFKQTRPRMPKDALSDSIVRDPNKCVLCGDCVRMCKEVQGIGAIDFVGRGAEVSVQPAFGKPLGEGECVNCGQCASVCPTGALSVKSEKESVWEALNNPAKTVVAQLAPAVRVSLGEEFGTEPGAISTGQVVAALKMMGFDKVYDTSFAADLTIIEEAEEFLARFEKGERVPQFTSCCPGWVKYAEQYFPELLPHISTCKSPQQMFGSLAKEVLPQKLDCPKEDFVVVSIMPCTAKKFEARRPEFSQNGAQEVDHVITTQELALMIDEKGIRFPSLSPESFDLPFGFKTGAGVIFGNSGGVSEAVLRYASEKISGRKSDRVEYTSVRGNPGILSATIDIDGTELKLAVVHSLINAQKLAQEVRDGKSDYHFIEVMACPGGCVGGAGQPISFEPDTVEKRSKGIYDADKMLQLHKSQENPYVNDCYQTVFSDGVGGPTAHKLLHTSFKSRRRIHEKGIHLFDGNTAETVEVKVCMGTNCYLKGSQAIMKQLVRTVEENNLSDRLQVNATFCMEKCGNGPSVTINGRYVANADFDTVWETVTNLLDNPHQ